MDIDLTELVVLAVLIVIAIVGLFVASAAIHELGLAIFVVAVIVAFWWIKRYYDRVDAGRR